MNAQLSITSQMLDDPPVLVLTLAGRLDATTVGQLDKRLADVHPTAVRAVIINLRDLTYVSSSGLRAMLTARSALRKRSGDLFMCALSRNVREVFDMVGFTAVFSIFDTQEQAVQAASALAGR